MQCHVSVKLINSQTFKVFSLVSCFVTSCWYQWQSRKDLDPCISSDTVLNAMEWLNNVFEHLHGGSPQPGTDINEILTKQEIYGYFWLIFGDWGWDLSSGSRGPREVAPASNISNIIASNHPVPLINKLHQYLHQMHQKQHQNENNRF